MSLTTSNVKHTAVIRYTEGLRQVPGNYRPLFRWHTDDEPSVRFAPLTGVGAVPQWSGGDLPTTQMDSAGASTVTYNKYGLQIQIDKYDAKDVPGIVEGASAKIGIAVAQTYAVEAASQFNSSFTTVIGSTPAGGQFVFDTDHPTASGATRSNKTTSALDRTAFMAAVQAYRTWVSYQNINMDLTDLGFFLVIPPGLEETAVEILGSQYSSSQMQVNAAGAYNTTLVVWPHLTDSNNWFLMSKGELMMGFWERSAPTFEVVYDQDNLNYKINVDFAIKSFVHPTPDGGYGSAVT